MTIQVVITLAVSFMGAAIGGVFSAHVTARNQSRENWRTRENEDRVRAARRSHEAKTASRVWLQDLYVTRNWLRQALDSEKWPHGEPPKLVLEPEDFRRVAGSQEMDRWYKRFDQAAGGISAIYEAHTRFNAGANLKESAADFEELYRRMEVAAQLLKRGFDEYSPNAPAIPEVDG